MNDEKRPTIIGGIEMATTTTKKDQDKNNGTQGLNEIKDKAQEAFGQAADKAKEIGSSVVKTADNAASTVGDNVKSFAGTIRENTPNEGMFGAASNALADGVESAGEYLSEQGVSGAAEDMTNLIRRNPIPAVLLALGVGYLLARATRS
jgi:hypothetical protein